MAAVTVVRGVGDKVVRLEIPQEERNKFLEANSGTHNPPDRASRQGLGPDSIAACDTEFKRWACLADRVTREGWWN